MFGPQSSITPETHHQVRGHPRKIPPRKPRPDPPGQMLLDLDVPTVEPEPRVVWVKPHPRHNPRRKDRAMPTTEDAQPSTCLPPETRTDVIEMKDAVATTARQDPIGPPDLAHARQGDPATSHAAAEAARGSIRRRMAQVLAVFQAHTATVEALQRGLGDLGEVEIGLTDDEVLRHAERRLVPIGSPSGLRTARKDLERAGFLEILREDDQDVTRPTRLGNAALVYVLTDAGRAYKIPDEYR